MTTARRPLLSYLPGFRAYLETSTKLGPVTRTRYVREVRTFATVVGNLPVQELTPAVLLQWHSGLWDRGSAPATIHQKHAAVKNFLKYLNEFEQVPQALGLINSLQRLQVPQTDRSGRKPYAVPKEWFDRMLAATDQPHQELLSVRNRCVLLFLWATGVRRAELIGLRIQDLDIAERIATVTGKGNKTRMVAFDPATAFELECWLGWRGLFPSQCDRVFISNRGHPLTLEWVSDFVKETAQRAGLPQPVWTHLLRHTRLTALLEGGMTLQNAAKIAGHARPETTMRYFHETGQGLREAYDRATAGRE